MVYRVPLRSNNLRSVGYDPQNQLLEIELSSDGIYRYYDVPMNVYREFMRAESQGIYYEEQIRLVYNFRRVG